MVVEIAVVLAEAVGHGASGGWAGVVKVRNWCDFASTFRMCGAAHTKPTFQPVRLKILPAEPILTLRSRMPSSPSTG